MKFSFKKSKDHSEALDRESVKKVDDILNKIKPSEVKASPALVAPAPPAPVSVKQSPVVVEEETEVKEEKEETEVEPEVQYVEREINLTLINEKLNQQTLMLKAIMEAMGFEIK